MQSRSAMKGVRVVLGAAGRLLYECRCTRLFVEMKTTDTNAGGTPSMCLCCSSDVVVVLRGGLVSLGSSRFPSLFCF